MVKVASDDVCSESSSEIGEEVRVAGYHTCSKNHPFKITLYHCWREEVVAFQSVKTLYNISCNMFTLYQFVAM